VNCSWYTAGHHIKEAQVQQVHKRFTTEQVKALLQQYDHGHMSRKEVQQMLDIGKTRFFAMLADYRQDAAAFSVAYERTSHSRLAQATEDALQRELREEKALVEDKRLPISSYNYSAVRDHLGKEGIEVSLPTVIDRAKRLGCYKPPRKTKAHDREVITATTGDLIQHDASHHLWSPYASEQWTLITSLDDYSRKLLYAEFVPSETTWAHIEAAQALMQQYGVPFRYYVDNLRVFRFVRERDSMHYKTVLRTDDVDPQWRQVMRLMDVDVVYALSPQAKGKVERPYRWLQDRVVRICAREKITRIEEGRGVLHDEIDRYNNRQVHSTTREIPSMRFNKARDEGRSLFRPFTLPKPYRSVKDVYCLHETRMVNGYRKITVHGHEIEVPRVELREQVDVHLVPETLKNIMEVRIWWEDRMVHAVAFPLSEFTVHL
jgi:transposase